MAARQHYKPSITVLSLALAIVLGSCNLNGESTSNVGTDWKVQRQQMVTTQIAARGVRDPRVLAALGRVPRHEFVPAGAQALAYVDSPLSIGHGQTISQPFIVGFMTEAAGIEPDDRVLEIGTGSGYQAAVVAEIAKEVYSVEIVEALGKTAAETLRRLGYENVTIKIGDGYEGWAEKAPFDAILVTAAPPAVPPPLLEQLRVGGHLVMPVGGFSQQLVRITKTAEGDPQHETLLPVRFVPMTGKAQER